MFFVKNLLLYVFLTIFEDLHVYIWVWFNLKKFLSFSDFTNEYLELYVSIFPNFFYLWLLKTLLFWENLELFNL
jgi:hypothetical protein